MLPESYFWLPGSLLVVVSSHAAAIAIAVAVGAWWAGSGVGAAVRLVAFAAAVFGLLGARVAFVALSGEAPGGLASMGGVASGLAATWCAARLLGVGVGRAFDAVVPAGLLGLGIGRIGCFLGGCCYGAVTTLPWAVVFPDAGVQPRHPLQLYSALVDFMLVATLGRSGGPPGRRALRTLAAFAVARTVLEMLRDPATTDAVGAVTVPQITCAIMLIATGVAALRQRARPEFD